jgi:hypothetical protein
MQLFKIYFHNLQSDSDNDGDLDDRLEKDTDNEVKAFTAGQSAKHVLIIPGIRYAEMTVPRVLGSPLLS